MKQSVSGRRRKILYSLMIILLCAIAVEVGTRIVTRGPRWLNPTYVQISGGFPELEALIRDNQELHPAPKYYEEFLYAAAPVSTTHVNFTNYYSARWTPNSAPLSEAEHVLWTFGGSTMENQETTDSLTIANTWAKVFGRALGPTHVKNFGTGGFSSSYELIKFQKLLRQVPESELPTIVIFYDGYNDANTGFQDGAGRMHGNLSLKLQALVEHDYLVLGTYALSKIVSKYSRFWEQSGARLVEFLLFPPSAPRADDKNLEAAVRVYTSNVRMIEATCEVFQVECFFVLQPLIVTKVPLTGVEQEVLERMKQHPRFRGDGVRFVRGFYERAGLELAGNDHFIDASHILNGRTKSDFYDLGHIGAETPPIVGERLADLILARLVKRP